MCRKAALEKQSKEKCEHSYAIWNLPQSGSHFATQTLAAILPPRSVLSFEFDTRLKGTTEEKNKKAWTCLAHGLCPTFVGANNCGAQKHGACAFCGVSSVGNPSPWFDPTNWTAVFSALGAASISLRHVVLVRTNTLKWALSSPAGIARSAPRKSGRPLPGEILPACNGKQCSAQDVARKYERMRALEEKRDRLIQDACGAAYSFGGRHVFVLTYESLQFEPFSALQATLAFLQGGQCDALPCATLTPSIVESALTSGEVQKRHAEGFLNGTSPADFAALLEEQQWLAGEDSKAQIECILSQGYEPHGLFYRSCFSRQDHVLKTGPYRCGEGGLS